MVQTKNRSTPVVEKREVKKDCGCGCKDCTCGPDCNCCCGGGLGKTFWKCTTMLISAVLISGAVLLQPCVSETLASKKPVPASPQLVENELQEFIRRNPKVIVDSLEKYEDQQAKKAERAAAKKAAEAKAAQPQKEFTLDDLQPADSQLVQNIIKDPSNYSLGNKDGKFVIIEFFDYQCGWCKRTNAALEEVIASEKGKNIRWIPIDSPIFGEVSETVARYVLAAGAQGKYAEMHKAVGEISGKPDEAALLEVAKKLGLNTKKLAADAKGKKIDAKMAANRELAQTLNIRGVPMLIVDGRINPGALLGERLDKVVEASQAKK